jgi:hypothetical protein
MQRRRIRGMLFSAAAVLPLVACSGELLDRGVSMKWAGEDGDSGPFEITQTGVRPGQLISVGTMPLCIENGSEAAITDLHFEQSQSLRLERFAVRATETPSLGTSSNSITQEGFDDTDHTVKTACASAGEVTELAADFVAESAGIVKGKNLMVEYASGDETKTLIIPVTVSLCSYSQEECVARAG